MSEPLQRTHTVEESGLRVVLHAHPAINLALVHNGVPLITALKVENTSDSDLIDVTVTVHLHGAGAELAPAWSRTHDGRLEPGREHAWQDLSSVVPATDQLQGLNESYRATITVTVSSLWRDTVHLTVPIKVLAHNEWFNAPIFYDSLAAFVQPNTRAVSTVLDAASRILQESTGDSSLGGYQAGPERAAMIAAAVYEALHGANIRYIDPPASFEDTGQKIRTTAQVLDQRFGTCIDLAVTYAACLEAAGIRPLVWLADGHAFAGFLRDEYTQASPTLTEQNELVNLVESGMAVPVEAIYYQPGLGGSFKSAVAKGRRHFADPDRIRGVIGIAAARKDGVLPLPSTDELVVQPPEAAPIVDRSPLELPEDLLSARSDDDVVLDTRDTAPARVRKWKRSLLDLSTRNRLLNLKPSTQVIDLVMPNSGLALLDDLAHAGKPITLVANDELSSIHQLHGARRAGEIDPELLLTYLRDDHKAYATVTRETYTKRFKELSRTGRTMFEETGSSNLYLTLGALVHRTSTGVEARAPLFLLPVKITGGTGRSPFRFEVDTTGVASPNYCLVEWLRLKHNASIEALESPKLDESGIDIVHALRDIRAGLVENRLDLRIDEVATIAICQFGTFGMWKDLSDHWNLLEQSPIVRHLTHSPGESFRDPSVVGEDSLESTPVDESDVPVPIPADGSQLRAVAMAAEGRTFVLEGPPGTGKSQTITNLIAHALSKGKTVLFVAEKQAALDVVKKRLARVGLSDFTLDLHGKNQSANVIREQLRRAIDNTVQYNEFGWSARLAEFRSRHAPLDEYPGRIHRRNGIDDSLWRAHEAARTVGDGPSAPVPAAYVAHPTVARSDIAGALEGFARAARSVEVRPGSPWAIVGSIADINTVDQISAAGLRVTSVLDAATVNAQAWKLLALLDDPDELAALLPHARRQVGRPVPNARTLEWWRSAHYAAARDAMFAEVRRLHQNCAPLLATFTPMFLEGGDVNAFVVEAEESTKGLFGKKKRLDQFQHNLAPHAVAGADLTPTTVLPLLRTIPTARAHIAQLRDQVQSALGPYAPPYWNPLAADAAASLGSAFEYVSATAEFAEREPNSWARLTQAGFPSNTVMAVLEEVDAAWREWRRILGTHADDLARWKQHEHWTIAWQRDASTWRQEIEEAGGRRLVNWGRMSAFLDPLRAARLDAFVDALLSGHIAASDAEIAFIRGAAGASVAERRLAEGLNNFDTALRDGEIDDFVRAAETLRDEQTKALPASLLARRPFQAGALRGEVGELRRQLDRKRGGTTFRQLMTRYGQHILAATPCMFVSPASLAQFVPPGSVTFDIVVFDEASQVTVPQAIGALGRGRSAVVVGDSQQMPPTSIGQVNVNESDEADESGAVAPDDLDSILTECVESQVPRLWLSWHYRSQDESLITFSNEKYYEGRLASLPSPGGDPTAGVEWRRVDGHFNREDRRSHFRTNRVEAEAIVEEIRSRLATPSLAGQSIGVVTFNREQQSLVQDLLEESGDPFVLAQLRPEAEEGIFVKNLENVQGDERDVILFTTAFSKKPGDPKLPLNFGPLGHSGGEKRFNVAVTRARRKVVIFTSYDPIDIDLSRTRSAGLAHLRAYLEMADSGPVSEVTSGTAHGDRSTNPVQESIAAALRARGYEVETNYGLSEFALDIVVREPASDRWQVAIVLDGPRWANRPTVSDRDLTPRLLEQMMHWGASLRVWLPEWIDAPDDVLDRIDAAIATANERRRQYDEKLAADAEARAAAIAEAETHSSSEVPDEPTEAAGPAQTELVWDVGTTDPQPATDTDSRLVAGLATTAVSAPVRLDEPSARDFDGRPTAYQNAPITTLGDRTDLDRLNSASVRHAITAAARETVQFEGPIALDRLARDIGRRFGFDRVSANRKEFITSCVPTELIRSTELGEFVWPRELDQESWRGFRTTPEDMSRPLAEIAPEEIANAMMAACKGRALDDEALMRETMALFGQRRLGQASRDRLAGCIEFGLASGRLIRIGAVIRAGA